MVFLIRVPYSSTSINRMNHGENLFPRNRFTDNTTLPNVVTTNRGHVKVIYSFSLYPFLIPSSSLSIVSISSVERCGVTIIIKYPATIMQTTTMVMMDHTIFSHNSSSLLLFFPFFFFFCYSLLVCYAHKNEAKYVQLRILQPSILSIFRFVLGASKERVNNTRANSNNNNQQPTAQTENSNRTKRGSFYY